MLGGTVTRHDVSGCGTAPGRSTPGPPLPSETTSVSIVIVNKGDPAVADTLRALREIHARAEGRTEVVVVDASGGALDQLTSQFPETRWIEFPPNPTKPTIPEQRNVGVRSSTGDVIVFLDAGCIPVAGWLNHLLQPIWDGEAIVAGGHRSAGGEGLRDEVGRRLQGRDYLDEAPTMCLAVDRRLFDVVGGFDEAFHYGSDIDFTWRVIDAGFRIRYAPDAIVSHEWGGRARELRRAYQYGQARARLYGKHRHRIRTILNDDPMTIAYPCFVLLLPVALVWPPYLLALLVPLVRNRGRRPLLTLVDHLATGVGVLAGVPAAAHQSRPADDTCP